MNLSVNENIISVCTVVVIVLIAAVGFSGQGESTVGAGTEEKEAEVLTLDADSLIVGIERYAGSIVETEGLIVHVCGVDGKKMKLRTASGAIIKIVPGGGLEMFDKDTYLKKTVKVCGVVRLFRIDESYIEKIEVDLTVLCHVDYAPCIDEAWISRKTAAGTADSISIRATNRLRERLKSSGDDYVMIVTIASESCEVIDEIEN